MSLRKKLSALILALMLAAVVFSYFGRIEHSRSESPDGRFVAIVAHRPMYYLPLPIYSWGVHSDSASFVTIEDTEGHSYGEVPVPLLQMAEVRWEDNSASISALAEWDLDARTCFYWNDDQTRKIYTKK